MDQQSGQYLTQQLVKNAKQKQTIEQRGWVNTFCTAGAYLQLSDRQEDVSKFEFGRRCTHAVPACPWDPVCKHHHAGCQYVICTYILCGGMWGCDVAFGFTWFTAITSAFCRISAASG